MRRWIVITAATLVMVPAAALYLNGYTDRVEAMVAAPDSTAAAPVTPEQATVIESAAVQPAPVAIAAPVAPQTDWAAKTLALQTAVTGAMQGFPGEYSVVVQDLKSGQHWAINPDQRYHPASTIKMPVTLYALEQYRTGKLGWQDLITYTKADFESPGGGALETAPFGSKYPVENLVGRALSNSNNIAVNMLGRYLGWDNIRAFSRTIGGELYRAPDGMPQVTVMSELGWWRHLVDLTATDPKNAEKILQPLRAVTYDGRIAAGLPKGVPYLHKFGSYDSNYHDGGWIMGDHPFLLIVLTHGATVDEADAAIARVTAQVYDVMSK